jgi:hypothetical protein
MGADPAFEDYLPTGNKKEDRHLAGQGGVFNHINLNLYHYASNNPIRYVDPKGQSSITWDMYYSWVYSAGNMAMWDGPYPFADAVYIGGMAIAGLIDLGIYYGPQIPALIDQLIMAAQQTGEKAQEAINNITNYCNKNGIEPPDPGKLGEIINRLKDKISSWQNHHWINQATLSGKNPHPLSKIAQKLGIDIKKVDWNISNIPHKGGHTKEYYEFVKNQLNSVFKAYQNSGSNWNKEQMETALQNVVRNIQEAVASGKIPLYKK